MSHDTNSIIFLRGKIMRLVTTLSIFFNLKGTPVYYSFQLLRDKMIQLTFSL